MKKKFFSLSVFAIAIVLITSSCSSDIDEGQAPGAYNGGKAITFEPWAIKQTKAAATQAGDMDNFAVLATDTSAVTQVLIDGAVVSGSNATKWIYSPTAFWPETATVNFFAYAPTGADGITNTGISALEGQNDKNAGEPVIEYELPTKLDDQVDLLVSRHSGAYVQDGASGVRLNFRHALSRVKFQAKSESGTNFVVLGLKLKNVKSKATLDLNKVSKDATAFPYPTDNATILSPGYQTHWVPDNLTTPTVVDLEAKLTNDTVPGGGGWINIVGDDDALYVIPQENTKSSLDSATVVDGSFGTLDEFYIEITYKDDLQTDVEAKTYAVPVPAIVGDYTASSLAFEMERQYTFRFELTGRKTIDFKEVKVSNYDDVDPDELPLNLKFAGSNIYYDAVAKHLTFDDFGETAHKEYQGVYFKWGSLTGISPVGVYSGSTATYPMGGAAVTVGSPAWGAILSVGADPGAPYNRDVKFLTETAHNPAAGVGDICKYLTEKGWAPQGKRWRMPTSAEFGAASDYTREPETNGFGGVTAANTDGSDTFSSGWRYKGAFFPASGFRGSGSGGLSNVGTTGFYWSSSPSGTAVSYYLLIDGTMADPTINYGGRTNAFTVRCVTY